MPLDPQLDPIIEAAAKESNVHPMLLRSLFLTESNGDPRAVSPAGAQGIAQLMPGTARELGVTDPFDPKQAIPAGARYLAQGLDKYNDPQKALMYYHGGPNEDMWGPKTQAYPNTVAAHYQRLTGSQEKPPTGIEALSNVGAPAKGGVTIDGNNYPDVGAWNKAMKGEALATAGGMQPSGIDALAQAGRPTAAGGAQVAQAGGEAIPTDAELMELLRTYKPPAAATAAGPAAPTAAPPPLARQPDAQAIAEANKRIDRNNTLGIPVNPTDVQTASHGPGMANDPEQKRSMEEAGTAGTRMQRPTGPGGTYENAPGSVQSDAERASAAKAASELLEKQPGGAYASAPGVDTSLAGRAKAEAAGRAEGALPSQIAAGVAGGSTKEFFERATAARDAVKSIENSQQAYDLLDKNVFTGTGAEFMLNVTKALHQAGLIESDKIANTEAFVASRAQEVGRIIKQFGAGTGLSDADREYAAKIAGGQIKLDEKSIREILAFNDRVTRTVIKEYNKDAEKITNPLGYPLTVVEPPARVAKERAASAGGTPTVGAVEQGYRYKGGNPADRNSWEKAP